MLRRLNNKNNDAQQPCNSNSYCRHQPPSRCMILPHQALDPSESLLSVCSATVGASVPPLASTPPHVGVNVGERGVVVVEGGEREGNGSRRSSNTPE